MSANATRHPVSDELKGGETLNRTIENFANRVVELLIVSDRGEAPSLSYLLKPGRQLAFVYAPDSARERSAIAVGRGGSAGSRTRCAARDRWLPTRSFCRR